MTLSTIAPSLLGGVLIGLATAMLLLFNGRIAGISGILSGVFASSSQERGWRALFLAGLVTGGLVACFVAPGAVGTITTPLPVLATAGVLVGFGTRLGAGCTSGHGVCGISRGSPRSFVATGTFMAVAGVVVFLVRHVGGR
ncbi:MAG: YeeE/YedE family protein [Polyangiaceae bacterium]